MNVCPYCSHDNQHEGPCARCGLEGNPSGTPWGIRKDRNTKYWDKYNWDSQTFTDGYGTKEPITAQERGNKINHDKIMGVIKPHKRGNLEKDPHFTASQPAMYDLTWHSTPREAVEEALDDAEQDGIDIDPDNLLQIFQYIWPGLEQLLGGELSEDEVEELIEDIVEEKEEVGIVEPDKESDIKGTPYKIIHRPGEKFPILFYECGDYLPRGLVLVELPNGMRIPFYSSAGETPKVDVGIYPGDWTALMGVHKSWYNKGEWKTKDGTKVNMSHWDDPQLKEVKAWLEKKWSVERIKKLKKHQLRSRKERKENSDFYSQMFLAHYPPLPSGHGMSDEARGQTKVVLEDLKKDNLYINNKVVKKDSPKPKKKEHPIRHKRNSHFGHSASVLINKGDKYEYTGEVTTLDPRVNPGTVDSPACSQCESVFKGKDYSTYPRHLIFQVGGGRPYPASEEDYARCAKIVTAMQAMIPAAVEYLSGGKHKIETIALIREDEYRVSTREGRGSRFNREKLEKQYPQIPKGKNIEHIKLIEMKSGGVLGGGYATSSIINLKHGFSPEEWAVIYFHELGHLFGHSPHWRMYHEFPGGGDKHCAYDCLFHHYDSCGNIAVGREKEIFKHFTTKASAPSFRNEPINYNMHTYSGALSRQANDREASKAGAPTPACRRCGHYHDKRLECPNLVYLAPHERFGYVKPKTRYNQRGGNRHVVVRNPSTQMQKTSTPVQMRPSNTHQYQPTGHAYIKPDLLVALDIDDTLVDTSQRMRSAKRMGLFDPKQVGNKQHPKGRQAFLEFFYSSDRFSLDKPIQGAVDFAYSLVQQGYKIAYITGRPEHTYEITKAQLRNLGFPLTNDKYGATLLYCKPEAAKETASWKKNILSSLQSNYDVRFFFDNNPKNLEAGRQLNIPGLYLAIDQYTGITALANRFKKVPAHIDNPHHEDEEEEAYRDMFDDSPWANPPSDLLPLFNGEPKIMKKNLGIVSAEVEVGRNIFADVGEGVQDIYRGLIGGRQSMTEKRMVMAVSALKKELSERAKEKGGQAVANLQVDFGSWKKSAIAVVAFGDAITLTSEVKSNPGPSKAMTEAKELYKEFNGETPDSITKTTISVPKVLVRVGEGGCWSVGYRSDKEGHGKNQKYIHEFGDFGRFPKKKPTKGNRKEPDLYAALDENGDVSYLVVMGGTFSLDTDPDTGINWLVG